MKKTRSILVYVGVDATDDAALRSAVRLAAQNEAHLEVACVLPELPVYSNLVLAPELDIDKLLVADRVNDLNTAVEAFADTGVSITTCVLRGKPAIELTRRVLVKGHDLVMKAARRDEAGGLFHGPLAAQLMRICPCPVWIVQPDRPERLTRIAAAVDPNAEDSERTGLNVRVLELASSLAELHGAELDVLHAWDAFGVDLLAKRLPEDDLQRYLSDHELAAEKRVAELLAHLKDTTHSEQVSLPRGDAKQVIPQFVAEHGVDLVVMGTVSRTGISGFFIGNTAEAVLRRLQCSMLTVKPAGFRSPVIVPAGVSESERNSKESAA